MNPLTAPWYRRKQRLYAGGRPNRSGKRQNRAAVWLFTTFRPLFGGRGVALEVRGRSSGRTVTLPLVLARVDGERYLVSMLGNDAGWVRNVQADEGRAVLREGRHREDVRLVDVPVVRRAPIVKRYLAVASGARPHIPVDRRAPLAEFEAIAGDYPVFRVTPR